jgi:tetratricopeptide (TPR) repeat protein
LGQDPRGEPEASLGAVDFRVPCDEASSEEFNRGIALLHHMTYPAALTSFQSVIRRDPGCALGYWGAGMTFFQPLWPNRPGPRDLEHGWELMQEARVRVRDAGRESDFIGTGEAFFSPEGDPDYWGRIERWAATTAALYRAHPEDREAQAFYALSLLATASRRSVPATQHREAAEILSRILTDEPTHPGAVHYTIHANDLAGREHESLDVVDRYTAIAPANAHALHMPTHIYVRLGEWDEVIAWNQRAASAALMQRVGPAGEYVWDEFPHAIEYLVYAQLQRGDDQAAEELIRTLTQTPDIQPSFKTAFHFASTRARYTLERRDWQGALTLEARDPTTLDWDSFPWPEAIVWFTRGLGAVHVGDRTMVAESLGHLEALSQRAASTDEGLFRTQIEILRLELMGWQAFGVDDRAGALGLLERAVSLEESTPKHPVTPAPTIPARELLADLYQAMGEYARALDAYRTANDRAPGRFNAVLGLARASAALGYEEGARQYYRSLLEGSSSASPRTGLTEAREFLRRE